MSEEGLNRVAVVIVVVLVLILFGMSLWTWGWLSGIARDTVGKIPVPTEQVERGGHGSG